jgi:hypothetical protein
MSEQEQIPSRQIERINGCKVNLAAMSIVELEVLERGCRDIANSATASLEIVRGALAMRLGDQGGAGERHGPDYLDQSHATPQTYEDIYEGLPDMVDLRGY